MATEHVAAAATELMPPNWHTVNTPQQLLNIDRTIYNYYGMAWYGKCRFI